VGSAGDVSQLEALLGRGEGRGAGRRRGGLPGGGRGCAADTRGAAGAWGPLRLRCAAGSSPEGRESGAPGAGTQAGAELMHSQSVPAMGSQLEGPQGSFPCSPGPPGATAAAAAAGLGGGAASTDPGAQRLRCAAGWGRFPAPGCPLWVPPLWAPAHNMGMLQGYAMGVPGAGERRCLSLGAGAPLAAE